MKYAFLVMGSYDSAADRAEIRNGATRIIGVSSVEEACEIARTLQAEGYVVHFPEQDGLFKAVFG